MFKLRLVGIGLLALTLVLTGCDADAIDKQAENIASQIEDVTSGAAQNLTQQVGQFIENTGDDWMKEIRSNGLSKQVTAEQSISNSVTLVTDHPLGNITVQPSASDQLQVEATLWASGTGANKEKMEQIFEQAEVSFVSNKDTLTLMIHPKGNSNTNLWDWANKEYNNSKFEVDYVIYAPKQIESYQLHSNVGNIALSEPQGTLQLQADVGEIQLTDATILGKSSINVSTGNLDMSIMELVGTASLEAKVEIGNITASVDSSVAYELEATTELGEITGADKGVTKYNGGGPRIELAASVGNITVSN